MSVFKNDQKVRTSDEFASKSVRRKKKSLCALVSGAKCTVFCCWIESDKPPLFIAHQGEVVQLVARPLCQKWIFSLFALANTQACEQMNQTQCEYANVNQKQPGQKQHPVDRKIAASDVTYARRGCTVYNSITVEMSHM